MGQLLFVVNPISGGLDKAAFREELKVFCTEGRLDYTLFETSGNDDEGLLKAEIARQKPQKVFACGGDGTVNLVARCVIDANIPMGIVPLGSANGLAKELGIPLQPAEAFLQVTSNAVRKLDVLGVNRKFFCLHLCSIGLNASIVERFDDGAIRGKLGYFIQFFRSVWSTPSYRYLFDIDGQKFTKRAESVIFANASKYGTGAVVNPKGKIDDRRFEVCIIKPYPFHAIFSMAWHFFFGNLKKSQYVKIYQASNAVLRSPISIVMEVDGELAGEFNEIDVEVLEGQLRVIVPEGNREAKAVVPLQK